jgi:hypothetical protein
MPAEASQGSSVTCVRTEPLRFGGIESLLGVDEHAPIGREHVIGAGLENQREILIDTEICKDSVADITEIEHIAGADARIGLKGTELGKMIL